MTDDAAVYLKKPYTHYDGTGLSTIYHKNPFYADDHTRREMK